MQNRNERKVGQTDMQPRSLGLGCAFLRSDEVKRALATWQWCRDRHVNIRHLAMQFRLAAAIDGIVMAGPADRQPVEDAFEAATKPIDPATWTAFETEFGLDTERCGVVEIKNKEKLKTS